MLPTIAAYLTYLYRLRLLRDREREELDDRDEQLVELGVNDRRIEPIVDGVEIVGDGQGEHLKTYQNFSQKQRKVHIL